jgi:hypothetical protein
VTRCSRCALRVSPGICGPLPHVFHTKPEDCIEALKAELARVKAEFAAEMREAQRDCAAAFSEGRLEGAGEGRGW